MTYTAKLNPEGTYTLMQDGRGIGLVKGSALPDYGLSETNLGIIPAATIENQTINTNLLTPATPITIPQPKVDTTNYNALVAGGQGQIGISTPTAPAPVPAKETDLETQIKNLNASLNPPMPSAEASYLAAYETSEMKEAEQQRISKKAVVDTAQAKLAGIQAQIQAVVDRRDAQNLVFERQASAGQVTGTILGRQQQEINRQAAIEALPLQALALAAQAEVRSAQGEAEYAQSTLAMAQQKLNTAFKLKSEDAKNAYDTLKDNRTAIYNFLTAAQKTRADAKQKEEDREFTIQRDNSADAKTFALKAMDSGQADLAVKIYNLDPKSETFDKDLGELQGQIKPKLTGTGKIDEFKQFFPDVNITTPEGRQQFLDWKARVGAAGRISDALTADKKAIIYDKIKQRTIQLFADGATEAEYQQMRQELIAGGLGSYIDDFDKFAKPKIPQQPLSIDKVRAEIIRTLQPQKDILTRDEAKTAAENQLSTALKLKAGQTLPKSYADAIKNALDEVYGIKKPWYQFW